jgi:hypothetical protein
MATVPKARHFGRTDFKGEILPAHEFFRSTTGT